MQAQDKVLILHGWGGSDAPHWQAELACEIAKGLWHCLLSSYWIIVTSLLKIDG